MSATTTFSIGGFAIYDLDDQVHGGLLDLFRKSEFVHSTRVNEESETEHIVRFQAPAHVIRDRLDVMGFDMRSARRAFDQGHAALVANLRERLTDPETASIDAVQEGVRLAIEMLSPLTFDGWREAFRQIAEGKHPKESSPLIRYLLEEDFKTRLGFPPDDELHFVRAALEGVTDDEIVEYDLSEVVNEFSHEPTDFMPDVPDVDDLPAVTSHRKLIVLTEGKTDRTAIHLALDVLYPHLVEFWSFLDYDGPKQPGGASQVVSLLKALAAAGVTNRIVAMFDNDTAATEALRALDGIQFPANIRIVRLPQSQLAKSYPTLGPSGTTQQLDINGLAVSIELFFGRDVLEVMAGELTPVQWRGYNATLRQYQGEILDKGRLLDTFIAKAKRCAQDRSQINSENWKDIRTVLDAVRNAFSS
jgi:hypothetical protein